MQDVFDTNKILTTRSVSHEIVDLAKVKRGSLRLGRQGLLKLVHNPTCWTIFISSDGVRAKVVHRELNIVISGLILPHNKGCGREWVKSSWYNYITNILGLTPGK